MKILVSIFVFLLAIVSVNGQNKASTKQNLVTLHIQREGVLPVLFMQQLHPVNTNSPALPQYKSAALSTVTLDTVVVHSVYNLPARHSYLYDSVDNCTRTRTEYSANGVWINKTQDTVVFDSVGNALSKTKQNWNGDNWTYSVRNLSKYGTNHLLLASVNQTWQNETWNNSDTSAYSYNQDGNIVSYSQKIWKNGSWVNSVFQLYVYDSIGNLEDVYRNVWKDTVWVNDQRYSYFYDSLGNVTSALIQRGVYQDWEYVYKENYSYDSAGNMISYLGLLWEDGSDSTWVNSDQYQYTYNSSGYLTSATGQNWLNNDSVWVNTEKIQYTYNQYGSEESELLQDWNDTAWADTTLSQYIFDNQGNMSKGDYYTFSNNTWGQDEDGSLTVDYHFNQMKKYFVGYHVDAYYHDVTTGIASFPEKQESISFSARPNPTAGQFSAQINVQKSTKGVLDLYTLTGRKLQTFYSGKLAAGAHTIDVNISNYPAGVYFIRFEANNRNQIVKIIKSK